jgi:2-dehydro-3-deoxyphosphooctonate aldolase (KDO 8-P synthase)
MPKIDLGPFQIGDGEPLLLISGPCVIESLDHALFCAESLLKRLQKRKINFVFKASYDKANRSSLQSFRGPGLHEGLLILSKIKEKLGIPLLTDVHTPEEAPLAAEVADIIQIPAFLCRQTDLVIACGKTKAAVNVKKGQFLAPWDMKNIVDKLLACGNSRLLLTDRGTSFGYNNLVSDFRSLPILASLGYPVCFDASHSVQLPGGLGHASGGEREFIPTLSKAAVAAGAHALYIESHPDPERAKSDAATVMAYDALETLLAQAERIHACLSATN